MEIPGQLIPGQGTTSSTADRSASVDHIGESQPEAGARSEQSFVALLASMVVEHMTKEIPRQAIADVPAIDASGGSVKSIGGEALPVPGSSPITLACSGKSGPQPVENRNPLPVDVTTTVRDHLHSVRKSIQPDIPVVSPEINQPIIGNTYPRVETVHVPVTPGRIPGIDPLITPEQSTLPGVSIDQLKGNAVPPTTSPDILPGMSSDAGIPRKRVQSPGDRLPSPIEGGRVVSAGPPLIRPESSAGRGAEVPSRVSPRDGARLEGGVTLNIRSGENPGPVDATILASSGVKEFPGFIEKSAGSAREPIAPPILPADATLTDGKSLPGEPVPVELLMRVMDPEPESQSPKIRISQPGLEPPAQTPKKFDRVTPEVRSSGSEPSVVPRYPATDTMIAKKPVTASPRSFPDRQTDADAPAPPVFGSEQTPVQTQPANAIGETQRSGSKEHHAALIGSERRDSPQPEPLITSPGQGTGVPGMKNDHSDRGNVPETNVPVGSHRRVDPNRRSAVESVRPPAGEQPAVRAPESLAAVPEKAPSFEYAPPAREPIAQVSGRHRDPVQHETGRVEEHTTQPSPLHHAEKGSEKMHGLLVNQAQAGINRVSRGKIAVAESGGTRGAIIDQIVKAMSMEVGARASEMRIVLEPASLGEVIIHVTVEGGNVSAKFDVVNPETRAVIESGLPQLQQALASRGLVVDRIDVASTGAFLQREAHEGGSQKGKTGVRRRNEVEAESGPRSSRYLGYNTLEITL